MRIPKGQLKFPDPKRIYDRDGKDSMLKYVEQFDRVNSLKPGGTVVNGKRV
jgi:hypothetical protein